MSKLFHPTDTDSLDRQQIQSTDGSLAARQAFDGRTPDEEMLNQTAPCLDSIYPKI
jgi:hypothetical protein